MNIAQITKETNTVAMHRILAILTCDLADMAFPVAMDALACEKKTVFTCIYIQIIVLIAKDGYVLQPRQA